MSLLPVLGLEDQKNTFRANIDIVRPLDACLKLEGNNNNCMIQRALQCRI